MIGYDFSLFWDFGRRLILGQDLYGAHAQFFPASVFLAGLISLIPIWLAYPIWTGANILMIMDTLRRRGMARQTPAWLASTPVLFVLLTGQIDLLFLWLSNFLSLENRWGTLAAAVITIKPQMALILLPWYLVRWLLRQPRRLLEWVGMCLLLHGIPLVLDPTIYNRWAASVSSGVVERQFNSTGIFSLSILGIPLWLLGIVGTVLAIWGLTRGEETSRAAMLAVQPIAGWYADVTAVGIVPWQLYLPLSWAAYLAAYLAGGGAPLMILSSGIFAWKIYQSRRAVLIPKEAKPGGILGG